MAVCTSVCICVCALVCLRTCVCTGVCICVFVCALVCVHAGVCAPVCLCTCVCTGVHARLRVCLSVRRAGWGGGSPGALRWSRQLSGLRRQPLPRRQPAGLGSEMLGPQCCMPGSREPGTPGGRG